MNTQSISSASTEIAFVDTGVANPGSFISQFKAGTEVHLLDLSQDAIEQITQVLANRSGVSAVHLVSHGSNGALQLSGETIDDLSNYNAELQLWSNSLTADADILLYGCNVAADGTGQAFVNQLGQLTGADIAASDDLTGQGGDWALEYQTGSIEIAAIADTTYQSTLANFFVTSTSDVVDASDGVLSLREAINEANTQPGTDNIFFSVNGTITLTGGELGINSDVNIYGNGASFTTISGNNASRVFNVNSGTVLLSGLTIANGRVAGDEGGGIFNTGTLTVQFCTFSGNSARGGGGIANFSSLAVNSSTFSGNSADVGGGILNSGTLTVNSSTFSGNSTSGNSIFDGGGIYNQGSLTVNGSTFSNNSARDGGGIFNLNSLTVNSSTFSGNSADRDGGGIDNRGGSLTVNGSSFSGNSANQGGGIDNDDSLTVNNSTFSNNSATFNGGGICNQDSLTVTGSYFLNNQATEGGGIANRFDGTSTLIANVISQNRATNGGGVFTNSGTVYLQLNNINSNMAATGVDLFGAFVSGTSTPGSFGFNVIGKGGGFSGIVNGVNGDVILVA